MIKKLVLKILKSVLIFNLVNGCFRENFFNHIHRYRDNEVLFVFDQHVSPISVIHNARKCKNIFYHTKKHTFTVRKWMIHFIINFKTIYSR